MAAFHPRTFELLHAVHSREAAQNAFDRAQLARIPASARSKRAEALRERMAAFPAVAENLTRLIAFAEAVNQLYADHDAGLHNDGVQRLDCPACLARRDGEPR